MTRKSKQTRRRSRCPKKHQRIILSPLESSSQREKKKKGSSENFFKEHVNVLPADLAASAFIPEIR